MKDLATCRETYEPITGQRMIIRDVMDVRQIPHRCSRCKAPNAIRYVTTQLRFDDADDLWAVSLMHLVCENPDCQQAKCYRWKELRSEFKVPEAEALLNRLLDAWDEVVGP